MRKADSNLKYRIFSLFLTIYKILHNQLHSTSVDLIFTNVLHKKKAIAIGGISNTISNPLSVCQQYALTQ